MMTRTALLVSIVLLLTITVDNATAREWSDSTGQFKIEAELVDVRDGTVRLRREDGTVISVEISRLGEADRRYLASRQSSPPTKPVLTLVKDGQPVSIIVTNGRPKEAQSRAAEELQEHIRLMSGATLAIVKENELPPDAPKTLILIGQSSQAKARGVNTGPLEPETFIVKTADNALILAGDDGGQQEQRAQGQPLGYLRLSPGSTRLSLDLARRHWPCRSSSCHDHDG